MESKTIPATHPVVSRDKTAIVQKEKTIGHSTSLPHYHTHHVQDIHRQEEEICR